MREFKFRLLLEGMTVPTAPVEWYDLGMAPNVKAIMQFTGLHDKNGKEIYEGDLLRRSDGAIDEVFYREDQGQFMVMQRSPDEIADDVLWRFLDDSEVIGNIYQNPA